jgi:nicotinamide mononucleotide transporter
MNEILTVIWGYPLSYLEAFGTLTGLVAVALAAADKIWTWPIGLVNVTCFFVLFWQVGLYSDMFLQLYFFYTGVYGWFYWMRHRHEVRHIRLLHNRERAYWTIGIVAGTGLLGWITSQLPAWWPQWFPQAAAFPYADALIAVMSIAGNWLLAKRVFENWVLWLMVDFIAPVIYFQKDIRFVALLYVLYACIAIFGCITWWREYRSQPVGG